MPIDPQNKLALVNFEGEIERKKDDFFLYIQRLDTWIEGMKRNGSDKTEPETFRLLNNLFQGSLNIEEEFKNSLN